MIDIGASLHSQFALLTYEFEDNSGFDLADADEKDNNSITVGLPISLKALSPFK